jgi:histidine triad (HIT) family protein
MPEQACVFCDILVGRAPARVVAEDGLSICLLDIQPLSRGHCLVIPRRHVPWWHELTPAENASLFGLARTVANRMMERLKPDFVCLYSRGRRVPHTHLFLVPTYPGDTADRHFNALERIQETSPDLAPLREPGAMDAAWVLLRGGDAG